VVARHCKEALHVVVERKTRLTKISKLNGCTAVRMTKREREIIALIADGMNNKEIAQQLNIATHTVKSHVHNIMEKLDLHTRLQLSKFTREENL